MFSYLKNIRGEAKTVLVGGTAAVLMGVTGLQMITDTEVKQAQSLVNQEEKKATTQMAAEELWHLLNVKKGRSAPAQTLKFTGCPGGASLCFANSNAPTISLSVKNWKAVSSADYLSNPNGPAPTVGTLQETLKLEKLDLTTLELIVSSASV